MDNDAPNGEAQEILREADDVINGPRNTKYGPANENFERIALIWSALLGCRLKPMEAITPGDVALLMSAVKLARLATTPSHRDSWVDLAGYAALGWQVREWPDEPEGGWRMAPGSDPEGGWPSDGKEEGAERPFGVPRRRPEETETCWRPRKPPIE